MGLREINATRTKAMIVDAAMGLFLEGGYDGTTMEDIAHRADIGTSTLYRYFPTKESVVAGFLGDPGFMADEVRDRPADESVEVALGHSLVAFLVRAADNPEQGATFSEIIDANPRPRARLLEWLQEAQTLLASALAERSGKTPDDVHVGAMAWMAIFVLQRSGDVATSDGLTIEQASAKVMSDLGRHPVLTPQFELPG